MFRKIKNNTYRKFIASMVLCTMIISLGGPSIIKAEEDNFPLPETYVDATSTDPSLTDSSDDFPLPESFVEDSQTNPASDGGNEGSAGGQGTDGGSGDATDSSGQAGANGKGSQGATIEDLLAADANGKNGTSASSGHPGANAGGSDSRWHGRAANVYIKTGDASAYGAIINYINSTVIGAPDIDIINIYGPTLGTLDFSNFNANTLPGNVASSDVNSLLLGPNGKATDVMIDASNEATLFNDLILDGSSGSNRIVGADGNVIIETGNVRVDASIFNMVNTSLIGKDWNFKVINIFSDLVGDLILPSLYSEKASAGCSGCLNSLNISAGNSASVGNNVRVDADSGDNSANLVGGSATIDTGNTKADSSIFNLVDTTLIGDNWNFSQFNITGNWLGKIFNTNSTADISGSNHSVSVRDENRQERGDSAEAAHDTATLMKDLLGLNRDTLRVNTDNNADVQNRITVDAASGKNIVDGVRGDATITTGNVDVNSAITNVVNTTVIGDGWQFYLVNIFGDWTGSAHYGMPDLAVSEIAIPNVAPARRGNTITYVYSYTNGGDAVATDVVLRDRFDADKVHVTDTSGGTVRGNTITWRIGSLRPRETRVLSYTTTVNAPNGSRPIQNNVSISSGNGDRNRENNSTGGQVEIAAVSSATSSSTNGSSSSGSGGSGSTGSSGSLSNPKFNIVKASERDTYRTGEIIPFNIILDNFKPGSGYEVGVVDEFLDPTGQVVMTKVWDLGEVYGFEHIEITYLIPVPSQAVAGPYLNRVTVYSKNARGRVLSEVVTNLPITVIAGDKDKSEIGPDELSGTVMIDALLDDNETVLASSDDAESLATTTPASSTDFVVTGIKVKRSSSNTEQNEDQEDVIPVVFGYTSDDQVAVLGAKQHASVQVNPFGFVNMLKINIALWLFLTLVGLLVLIEYRYFRNVSNRNALAKKRINSFDMTNTIAGAIGSLKRFNKESPDLALVAKTLRERITAYCMHNKNVIKLKIKNSLHALRTYIIVSISSVLLPILEKMLVNIHSTTTKTAVTKKKIS